MNYTKKQISMFADAAAGISDPKDVLKCINATIDKEKDDGRLGVKINEMMAINDDFGKNTLAMAKRIMEYYNFYFPPLTAEQIQKANEAKYTKEDHFQAPRLYPESAMLWNKDLFNAEQYTEEEINNLTN